MNYVFKIINSPVGKLKLIASDEGLAAILWQNDNPKRVKIKAEVQDASHPILRQAESQLKEYFAKKRERFSVKLDFHGTHFQKQVWNELLTIPFGETKSYGELAKKMRRPNAARAVGSANGRNPISIIVPCHRVIGSNGTLTGFAGGLTVKAKLLKLEAKIQINAF